MLVASDDKEPAMTRRLDRLTLGAALAGGLCALTIGAAAQSNAPTPVPALTGVPVFQPDPKWPVLPADWRWGQVIGIFADARGHVWTSSSSRITEWDPQGKLVQSWDARGPDGTWSTIHGMFVDHNGFVWTNARESNLTVKFTPKGQVALVIGKFNETGGSNDTALMGRPSEIWVDAADNEVFVADGYGNRRIIVFDGATGKYLRHWGAYGKRPEDPQRGGGAGGGGGRAGGGAQTVPAEPPQQFSVPHGITGSRDGLIYLADRANNRIQVFRQNGEFVAEKILRPRCGAQEQATWAPKRPCGTEAAFSVGFSHDVPQTYLYVADGGTHVITVLRRKDLEVVSEFAAPGAKSGQLGRPHNLSVDPWGNIFVAEAAGPIMQNPVTGEIQKQAVEGQKIPPCDSRLAQLPEPCQAGYRAQKFTYAGTK
jgi:streptogramin lyase